MIHPYLAITMNQSNNTRKSLITLFISLVASLASSLCCLGPLLYLSFGISAAGLTHLSALSWLQLPMIIIATGTIILGFWRLYISSTPICEKRINRKILVWLYWLSMPVSLAMMSYPFVLPLFLE